MRPYLDLPPPTPQQTLQWMQKLATEGAMDPVVRSAALDIVREVWGHDYLSEYAAVFDWVRRNVRYVRDPVDLEQVQTARATLEIKHGDCDDLAVVIAALVGSLGGQTRFTAGAFRRDRQGRPVLSHVWCEAFDPRSRNWVVLDPVPGRRVNAMLGNLIDHATHPGVSGRLAKLAASRR